MRSAFGVDHGEISKYSKAHGTNRYVEAEYQANRMKRIKALKLKKAPVTKAFSNIAGALERAHAVAEPGSAAHAYTTARLHAGKQGAKVAGALQAKQPVKSGFHPVANKKILTANRAEAKVARQARRAGVGAKKAAAGAVPEKAGGGLARMETPAATGTPYKSGVPRWAQKVAGMSNRNLAIGSGVAGGVAGGGGALYVNRKRSA